MSQPAIPSHAFLAQTGKPFLSCWQWQDRAGTQFADRAAAWTPDLRTECPPKRLPDEWPIFDTLPPCGNPECTGPSHGSTTFCPPCRRAYMDLFHGYAFQGADGW